jgi:hypothetical protein
LQIAEHQGSQFTQIATALKLGRAALSLKETSSSDSMQKQGEIKHDRQSSAKSQH